VTVANTGQLSLGPFEGVVTTTSEWVRVADMYDTLSYGRIDPGGEAESSATALRVEIAPDTPPDTRVPLSCTLVDGDDALLPVEFEVTVRAGAGLLVVDEVVVEVDNNRNGRLDLGETAAVRVALRNAGTSRVTSSECDVTTSSPHAEVQPSYDTLSYPSLDPGDLVISARAALKVKLLASATEGLELPLDCTLTDGQGGAHPLQFVVPVHRSRARLAERGVEIRGDDSGDGALQTGESAYLRLSVENVGSDQISATSGEVRSLSPEVEVLASYDTVSFGGCVQGDTVDCGTTALRVRANERPAGGVAELAVDLTDAEGNQHSLRFDLEVAP